MLTAPYAVWTAGVAALAGAWLVLLGRLDASLPLVMLLVLAARAAAPAADPRGASALTRLGATIPAWVAVAIVGALRTASPLLADVRGANAVVGPALTHGAVGTVAAAWLAVLAGVLAVVAPAPDARLEAWTGSAAVVDRLAVATQLLLLATVAGGPQVVELADLGVWVALAALVAGGVVVARRAPRELALRGASVAGGLAVAVALIGGSV